MYKLNSVKKNIIVDTITPVSIYLKLRDKYSNTILLESSDYSAKDNSYAYICCNPIAKFYVKKNTLFTEYPDGSKFQKEVVKDIRIFSELEKFMNKFSIQDDSNQSKMVYYTILCSNVNQYQYHSQYLDNKNLIDYSCTYKTISTYIKSK